MALLLLLLGLIIYGADAAYVRNERQAEEMCEQTKDIVFLMDTSLSVDESEFPKMQRFVNQLISRFDVSEGQTRFAVIPYSQEYQPVFGLDDYNTVEDMQAAVNNITFSAGKTTNTLEAIGYVLDNIFNNSRPDVKQIIITLTDGQPTNRYAGTPGLARARGVLMFAVGVGKEVRGGLALVATEDTDEFIYQVDTFDRLPVIIELLSQRACVATTPVPIITTTEEPSVLEEESNVLEVCRAKPADVAFVMDSSTSVGKENFAQLKHVMQDIVGLMDIGPDATRIAAVTFSTSVRVNFDLEEFSTKDDIINAIGNIDYMRGNTNTGGALSKVRTQVFAEEYGGRGSASAKIMIVVTDGMSQRKAETVNIARELHDDGVIMFAIGVGKSFDKEELLAIASTPSPKYFYCLSEYAALESIKLTLARLACEAAPAS